VAIEALPAGWELRAALATTSFAPNRDGWQGEVKAATHHGLKIAHGPGGWHARIIIDV
jgi:SHS2 domain-containing protein